MTKLIFILFIVPFHLFAEENSCQVYKSTEEKIACLNRYARQVLLDESRAFVDHYERTMQDRSLSYANIGNDRFANEFEVLIPKRVPYIYEKQKELLFSHWLKFGEKN